MAKNFSKTYTADDGTPIPVHVNRRGCKGRWTKKHDEMMRALVNAVHEQSKDQRASAPPDPSPENPAP